MVLDATEFDRHITRKTNETAGRAFPVMLNVDHPEFFQRLETCAERNKKLHEIENSNAPRWWKKLKKLPLITAIFVDLVRLYFIKPVDAVSEWEAVY